MTGCPKIPPQGSKTSTTASFPVVTGISSLVARPCVYLVLFVLAEPFDRQFQRYYVTRSGPLRLGVINGSSAKETNLVGGRGGGGWSLLTLEPFRIGGGPCCRWGRTGDDLRAGRGRQVAHADCFGNEALQEV